MNDRLPSLHEAAHAPSHGSMKSYAVGFVLSLVLTLASFAVVMSGAVSRGVAVASIVALCVAQLVVQLVFFLHMGTSRDQRENVAVFGFSALIIVIIVSGSLWVMHNANVNMMPAHMSVERAMSRD